MYKYLSAHKFILEQDKVSNLQYKAPYAARCKIWRLSSIKMVMWNAEDCTYAIVDPSYPYSHDFMTLCSSIHLYKAIGKLSY